MIIIGYISKDGSETLTDSYNSMADATTGMDALKLLKQNDDNVAHYLYASGDVSSHYEVLGYVDK